MMPPQSITQHGHFCLLGENYNVQPQTAAHPKGWNTAARAVHVQMPLTTHE